MDPASEKRAKISWFTCKSCLFNELNVFISSLALYFDKTVATLNNKNAPDAGAVYYNVLN